ncbi:MAG: cell division protein ZipA C-terminal FtsZ-binding domain-containing protein [Steroidobacteraceae bacterium]
MPELRWILLVAGVALILALWWWEARKARAKDAEDTATAWPSERAEPTMEDPAELGSADTATPVISYSPTIERIRVPRRPPMIEIPEDFEVDISDFVSQDRRRGLGHDLTPEPEIVQREDIVEAANEYIDAPPEDALPQEQPDDHHRAPWVRTHPLERDELQLDTEEEPPEPVSSDPIERHTAEAARQRIVALRLIAAGDSWNGGQLRMALEAEGLHFGRYSIFHREREDGKSLFYVASMMEPGSFDLASMDDQEFPGISLFGIVPGPLDAPSTFDLVLTIGRHLAERMKGQLQDEQGSTLTAQRILNLREELVHFEHRNRRLRRN